MGTINSQIYEAAKAFSMGGRDYRPGDPIDVSDLPDHKVGQLLNQRYIRPIKSD
jgi:hypothetical protein